MIVELLKSEQRFKISKGEIFYAEPYSLDPSTKVVLLSRIPDGFKPDCTEYRHNVKIIPMKIKTP
jgi:hypothetical protein